MKNTYILSIGILVGAAIGAASVGTLSAQDKAAGAYAAVAFSDFGDPAAFKASVGEPSPAVIKKHGGRFLARTDTITVLRAADPPLTRYVIIGFDDVQQARRGGIQKTGSRSGVTWISIRRVVPLWSKR